MLTLLYVPYKGGMISFLESSKTTEEVKSYAPKIAKIESLGRPN